MNGRRPTLEVRTLRLPGDGAEEVRVGAYAQRLRRRRNWSALFGAALMIGAVGLYLNLRPESDSTRADEVNLPIRCAECGYEGSRQMAVSDSTPVACPKCGLKRARPLWKCQVCGDVFLPAKAAFPVRCGKCGSDRVGSAAPAPPP